MSVNRDEITCDECKKRIGPVPDVTKPYGWEDLLTAECHVCQGCWEVEVGALLRHVNSYTDLYRAMKKIMLPIRTFIGRVIEYDTVRDVMEKFSTSQT